MFTPRALRTFGHLRQSHLTRPYLYAPPAISQSLLRSRYASSTSPPARASSLSTVNGPPSTLPSPLIVPERKPDQSYVSYLFASGKAYLGFYKTGAWNIWTNFKTAAPIQQNIDDKYRSSLSAAVAAGALNRRDFQLLARNWHDIKRLPVFILVFIVCGEFTPLVVIFMSNVVPWTCRIPKQVNSDREKLEERRAISFRNLTSSVGGREGVDKLGRMELLHISWSLRLSSTMWDRLGGRLPGPPTNILRNRVRSRVEYLTMDDELIRRAGGVKNMESEECRMACVERGINVIGRSDTQLKSNLDAWLKSRETVSIEKLLLSRPSVWPVRPRT